MKRNDEKRKNFNFLENENLICIFKLNRLSVYLKNK